MFYDKYAQLCKQKGVSVSAAAIGAGVSKSLVTKWKANKVETPSPEVLRKLSTYFNMPVSELMGEEKEKPTVQEDDGLTESQRLLREYSKVVPADKAEMVLRVIQSIVEAD